MYSSAATVDPCSALLTCSWFLLGGVAVLGDDSTMVRIQWPPAASCGAESCRCGPVILQFRTQQGVAGWLCAFFSLLYANLVFLLFRGFFLVLIRAQDFFTLDSFMAAVKRLFVIPLLVPKLPPKMLLHF